MAAARLNSEAASDNPSQSAALEVAITREGNRLFDLIEASESPSFFSKKGFYHSLMDSAMSDPGFRTQLFRFVDVFPSLKSNREIARHLQQYLGEASAHLSPAMRLAFKAATGGSWLLGPAVEQQMKAMARQFMLGNDPSEIILTLHALHQRSIGFTVDVLGEAVLSEKEADAYAARYLDLLEWLAPAVAQWKGVCPANVSSRGPVPPLNLSVKISALYSQISPADPHTAVEQISRRLAPILRRAVACGAFINFDMESYALKPVTLQLFKTVFGKGEFASQPECGIALQAYLRDSEDDLRDLAAWAGEHRRRITVRLVKGAYWDYETVIASQRNWPVPVFATKAETDASFERLSDVLLANPEWIDAAFGTHNVRSVACVLALAEKYRLDRSAFEFQMLHGMAEPVKSAVLQTGCRLREYCPLGELLPGMAYLVRRLLENTSNEGFLVSKFGRGASREELLKPPVPREHRAVASDSKRPPSGRNFSNEPPADFSREDARLSMRAGLEKVRRGLGERLPLIINHKSISTEHWLPSLNPANQEEVIGQAAQAGEKEALLALHAARSAQSAWGRAKIGERADLVRNLAALLRRDRFDLAALEILEAGKNWAEADADVVEAIDFCNFYAAAMEDLQPRTTQAVAGESNLLEYWPRGVGVIIAPWNFPLAILTGMMSAAIVTGNTVILKPSDQTPIIAGRLMRLVMEAGFPPGVVNLVTGPGAGVASFLVAHPGIDLIAFTGSKEVGLRIWETAGHTLPGQANLKRVICEMGGKNCMIVDSDADLDEAVAGCIGSAFGYAGQKCSALSRLLVLEENYEKFLSRFIEAAASLRIGPAEDPGAAFGPVISRSAHQRILAMIETGKSEARLVWQGTVPNDANACYVPPTIFTDVPPDSRLFREEIFGPVLAISKVKDFSEALALANSSDFALTGGCYSRNPENIDRAKAELVCGNLYINRSITGAVVERQPFGGFKMSGGGTKAGGAEYLHQFLVPRVVTENQLRRGFVPGED